MTAMAVAAKTRSFISDEEAAPLAPRLLENTRLLNERRTRSWNQTISCPPWEEAPLMPLEN